MLVGSGDCPAERREDLARELLEGWALRGLEAPAARRNELQVACDAGRMLGGRVSRRRGHHHHLWELHQVHVVRDRAQTSGVCVRDARRLEGRARRGHRVVVQRERRKAAGAEQIEQRLERRLVQWEARREHFEPDGAEREHVSTLAERDPLARRSVEVGREVARDLRREAAEPIARHRQSVLFDQSARRPV